MGILIVLLILVGILFLALGIFVEAVKFLLWLGIALLIIGVIVWLMKYIRRNV
ncbi:hypothetical protein [Compostimonas suwonensis]|uniref:Uncharacterized protein n=1 Tax=Compostimonas suwonensis TaxID=1048394 RepID=A0A2M9BV91_9MICO|nr:hypothetical protein [Compostimonas suwonensis]PJJ61869.1 hypothetical protein CLV54_1656 [Compostimonas suwonensis]